MSRVMTKREAADRLGISPQTLTRMERQGAFPKRVPISQRRIGYLEEDVDAFITRRVETRNDKPAKVYD